ncbi:MAG: adenylate/guanylate cyclase domain-containing protein, partial [Arenibacterium sp.]
SRFDELAEKHGLEKVKTIGDAYMAAAGMPIARSDHADRAIAMAFDMLDAVRKIGDSLGENLHIRIGLHSGPAIAGVIGNSKIFYDVWGDTVNTASRMESYGSPGRIQVTKSTREALGEGYLFETRGEIDVKGMGKVETFWLLRED